MENEERFTNQFFLIEESEGGGRGSEREGGVIVISKTWDLFSKRVEGSCVENFLTSVGDEVEHPLEGMKPLEHQ